MRAQRLNGPYNNCFLKSGYIRKEAAYSIMAAKDNKGEYILPGKWYDKYGHTFWEAKEGVSQWLRYVAETDDTVYNARGEVRQRAPAKNKAARDAMGQYIAPAVNTSSLTGMGRVEVLDHLTAQGIIDQDLKHLTEKQRATKIGLADIAASKVKFGRAEEETRKELNEARKRASKIEDIKAQLESDLKHLTNAKPRVEAVSTCYDRSIQSRGNWKQKALKYYEVSKTAGLPVSDIDGGDDGDDLPETAKEICDWKEAFPDVDLPSSMKARDTKIKSFAKMARRQLRKTSTKQTTDC